MDENENKKINHHDHSLKVSFFQKKIKNLSIMY